MNAREIASRAASAARAFAFSARKARANWSAELSSIRVTMAAAARSSFDESSQATPRNRRRERPSPRQSRSAAFVSIEVSVALKRLRTNHAAVHHAGQFHVGRELLPAGHDRARIDLRMSCPANFHSVAGVTGASAAIVFESFWPWVSSPKESVSWSVYCGPRRPRSRPEPCGRFQRCAASIEQHFARRGRDLVKLWRHDAASSCCRPCRNRRA